jgi:hypothetical protein
VLVGSAAHPTAGSSFAMARLTAALIFADGLERSSTQGWSATVP